MRSLYILFHGSIGIPGQRIQSLLNFEVKSIHPKALMTRIYSNKRKWPIEFIVDIYHLFGLPLSDSDDRKTLCNKFALYFSSGDDKLQSNQQQNKNDNSKVNDNDDVNTTKTTKINSSISKPIKASKLATRTNQRLSRGTENESNDEKVSLTIVILSFFLLN